MAREIPLTKGLFALIDDEDYDWARQWNWYATSHKSGGAYAARYSNTGPSVVYLHRALLGAAPGQLVDHANRNRLDDRRSNLRFASIAQNYANTAKTRGESKFRGVSWAKAKGMWEVRIQVDGKSEWLGHFLDDAEAAHAYDARAKAVYGEFAVLNHPEERP